MNKYFDPIMSVNGSINISSISPEHLTMIAERECLITDAKNELAFLSIFEPFSTIMLYKHNDIEKLTKLNFEHIICDNETTVN